MKTQKPPRVALLFYRGHGFPGWAVRTWTRSPFAHVAILVDGIVYEALAGGIVRHGYFNASYFPDDSAATLVPTPPISKEDFDALETFLALQLGKPYDWTAIIFDVLGVLLGKRARLAIADNGSWDCSRLAAAAWEIAHFPLDGVADLRCPVSPGDLYKLVTKAEVA